MDNWIKVATWLMTELYDFLSWFTGGFDGQLCAMMRLIVCDWITIASLLNNAVPLQR